jgi:ribonuclease J
MSVTGKKRKNKTVSGLRSVFAARIEPTAVEQKSEARANENKSYQSRGQSIFHRNTSKGKSTIRRPKGTAVIQSPASKNRLIKNPRHRFAVKTSEKKIEIPPPAPDTIRVIPLGGVEEIGKNMTVVEWQNNIVIIDCGIKFADEDTPGIDYILPNITYLKERKDKIRALVITHGHLDHIGGIPYLISDLGFPPIYTREFGALLIKKRQLEFPDLPPLDIKIVSAEDGAIPLAPGLKIKFFGLTHAIPDSSGVIVETPDGNLVFTGDVRVENRDGVPTEKEEEQYKIFQNQKTLLLAMDSTGIDRSGWTIPEEKVVETIDRIVSGAPGRVIIATFASQVDRIIGFLQVARKYNRKVIIDGRSMKNNIEIVKQLRLAEVEHVVPMEEVGSLAPNKIMVIATGGQGEEFAALVRMAAGTHKEIKIKPTDTVILSASVIPGNERGVEDLKDNLYRHDCKVITYLDTEVHTSGHGKRGELEWLHRRIPYKFFMPIHGQHFRLKMHAELAETIGTPRDHIVVPDNGSIVEIKDHGQKIVLRREKVPANPIMVDGFSVGNIQEVVLRDRQMLAEDGMFVIIASLNTQTGKLKKSPDIISRGFVYLRESQELLSEARFIIKKTIEDATKGMRPINFDYIKDLVADNVGRFLFQKTAKRPIVIPVVLGV